MKIPELFKNGHTVFSFEVFPPKKDADVSVIYDTLDQLGDLHPDFISVTYGAGGSAAGATTTELVRHIKENLGTESIAHLTCVNSTHADIDEKIKEFEANGIENVLALRGDINPNFPPKNEFLHASDLIEYMKPRSNLSFSGGCYPEVHPEASSMVEDILHLKKKVDAGASHLISQLFFDNSSFIEFLEKARIAGIDVPIEAGIMPCVNAKSGEVHEDDKPLRRQPRSNARRRHRLRSRPDNRPCCPRRGRHSSLHNEQPLRCKKNY